MLDRWEEPVRVQISGVTHLVFNDTGAAEMLLMNWPATGGNLYKAAQAAIAQSIRSKGDPRAMEAARNAFAAAAREAGILLRHGNGATNQIGYHLVGEDGSETFTTNSALAKTLQSKGWMNVGFVALPIVATEAMIYAGEQEYQRLIAGASDPLPPDGIYQVLKAALKPLNGV